MTSPRLAGVRSRLRTIDSRIPDPVSDWGVRLGKFVLCGAVGMVLWVWMLTVLNGQSIIPESTSPVLGVAGGATEALLGAAIVFVPPVASAVVHHRLPTDTFDNYHRFGKSAALFATVNIALSATFLAFTAQMSGLEGPNTVVVNAMFLWAWASVLIPGPYLGVLVAARWARE